MIQIYKIVKDVADVDKKLFTNIQESAIRGHNFKLRKTKATKLSRINAFSKRVILIIEDWNSLPCTVVNAETTDSFKKEIDEHWVNKMYDTPF